MNGTNIHDNKSKSKSKVLLPAIAMVIALAIFASTLVATNDAAAARDSSKNR